MKNRLAPLIMIIGGLLLLAGAIYLVISTKNLNAQSNIPNPEIKRVSLSDARKAYDSQSALFIDVRDPDSFASSHIPGAINIPQDQLLSRLEELSSARWIITYCT
jgi:3-mercaptopyruvate sulfurtransferase SseA